MFRPSSKLIFHVEALIIACALQAAAAAGEAVDGVSSAAAAQASTPSARPVFSAPLEINNVWAPFQPGAVKVYRGKREGERLVVTVLHLDETRPFVWDGGFAETRVVKELGFVEGELEEVSWEFFAQADDGTVHQFGELVDNYEKGVVTDHEGSWLVGGPSLPGDPSETATAPAPTVVMPADPQVGDEFKPEDLYPIVDETILIVDITKKVKTPAGKFTGLLKLKETSRIEGTEPEKKWVAKGVGVVRVAGADEALVLISTSLSAEPEPGS